MSGKDIRISRLFNKISGKTFIVAVDHGVTYGLIDGLNDMKTKLKQIVKGGPNAVILHKGFLKYVSKIPELLSVNFIMHLSASTSLSPDPKYKVLVASVEEAIQLGADAISVHVNLGTIHDSQMIKDIGKISEACMKWGMPLLAMMYTHKLPIEAFHIAHAARFAEEVGADIIKINYPGSKEALSEIVKSINVPVIVAGGEKLDDIKDLLIMINNALAAGVSGVAIGRNIFQYKNSEKIVSIINNLIHGILPLDEALREIDK